MVSPLKRWAGCDPAKPRQGFCCVKRLASRNCDCRANIHVRNSLEAAARVAALKSKLVHWVRFWRSQVRAEEVKQTGKRLVGTPAMWRLSGLLIADARRNTASVTWFCESPSQARRAWR